MPHAAGVGFVGDNGEGRGGEEILGHRAPKIPERLDGRMFFAGNEGLGIEADELPEAAEEFGRAVQADRRLQVRAIERLAEKPAEFAVETDAGVGVREARDVLDMATQWKDHVDFGTDPLDEPPDLREIGGHVEHAVAGADDVDPRLGAWRARLHLCDAPFLRAELAPQPRHRAVSALPLVLVDRPRQKSLDIRTLRRHPAADHLGDGSGDDDAGQIGVEGRVGALHRAFGAVAAKLLLGEAGHDDG